MLKHGSYADIHTLRIYYLPSLESCPRLDLLREEEYNIAFSTYTRVNSFHPGLRRRCSTSQLCSIQMVMEFQSVASELH